MGLWGPVLANVLHVSSGISCYQILGYSSGRQNQNEKAEHGHQN